MKITGKQILCALLAGLMLSSTGCSGTETETTPTETTAQADVTETEAELTESELYPLPQTEMGGMELRFLNYSPEKITWALIQIDAEEENADLINDEIYHRNLRIEDTYDCLISETQFDDPPTTYKNMIRSGDDAYDIGMIYDNALPSFMTEGMIYSWDHLPYVDLERSWWDQGANSVFSFHGQNFAAVGDFYLGMLTRGFIIVFNKDMYADMGLDYNLYDLVREGKWTLDRYAEIAEQIVMDLNGDGVMDDKDQYASAGAIKLYFASLLIGSGVKYFALDESGQPYFTIPTDSRAMDIMMKISQMHEGKNFYFQHYFDTVHSGSNESREMFNNGQLLFQGTAINSTKYYRECDFDIGILPFPKYDDAQEEYYVHTSECGVTTVPVTVPADRLENISILLDALCRDSQHGLHSQYKETVLKSKYSRDEDSAEMLDIIFDSAAYDLGLSIWPGETHYRYMELYMKGQNTFASTTESIQKSIEKTLETFSAAIAENMN